MWSDWTAEVAVLQQMLVDRRYTALRSVGHGTDPLLVCSCRDVKDAACFVYFTREDKVGVKTLRRVCAECKAGGAAHLILVSADGLTHFATRELQVSEGLYVETFRKTELSFNVTKHRQVPPHRLLTPGQRRRLLVDLGSKPHALPKIKENDPVVRYYNWTAGSVVRIDRRIGALESEPVFRLVTA